MNMNNYDPLDLIGNGAPAPVVRLAQGLTIWRGDEAQLELIQDRISEIKREDRRDRARDRRILKALQEWKNGQL